MKNCDVSKLIKREGCCDENNLITSKQCDRETESHLKSNKVTLEEDISEWQLILSKAGKGYSRIFVFITYR
jgi:hypothetical protein